QMDDTPADVKIFDALHMSSLVARNPLRKITPETFAELTVTNTTTRLQVENGDQPVDKFVRCKNDIDEWYNDMREYGLNNKEISLMEKHLLSRTGIMDTQELIMNTIIDQEIANGGLTFANYFH